MLFEEMDYDDSDRRIWEAVYVKVYAKKKIGEKFDINNAKESEERKRIVAKSWECNRIEVGGETDFNFSSKIGIHRQSKYGIYKKILSSIDDKKEKRKH